MAITQLQKSIKFLREGIKKDYDEFRQDPFYGEVNFKYIDEFIASPVHTDLEKAFFLILHQFPDDHKDYIIRPREMVLLPDIYDMSRPGIEYEIDFALYGGSIDNPVKVAIECDGMRSHGERHVRKDRRKDVNLQAAGWIIMRFSSKEIHQEIQKFNDNDNHVSDFLTSIENTIIQKLKLINHHTYRRYRSKLTGYTWGTVTCLKCAHTQDDILNHTNITCQKCGEKFKREIKSDEKIAYNYSGLLFFTE